MSVKLCIIGDSNVDRYFPVVRAARKEPSIQDATVVRATNLAQIKEALVPTALTEARSHVLLACLTNPITNYPYEGAVPMLVKHCEEVFDQLKAYITEARGTTPGDLEQVNYSCQVHLPSSCDLSDVCKFSLIFLIRYTSCPQCTVSLRFGINGATLASWLPFPPPSASLTVVPTS
jgi:hypothetical protein